MRSDTEDITFERMEQGWTVNCRGARAREEGWNATIGIAFV